MPARPKAPPATLGVLGQTVTFVMKPKADMPDAYGLWHEQPRSIDLRDDQSSLDLRDTALHELFHAIRTLQGREYGGKVEEDYVRSLATGLTVVLRDNPEFARWLISHPKKKP